VGSHHHRQVVLIGPPISFCKALVDLNQLLQTSILVDQSTYGECQLWYSGVPVDIVQGFQVDINADGEFRYQRQRVYELKVSDQTTVNNDEWMYELQNRVGSSAQVQAMEYYEKAITSLYKGQNQSALSQLQQVLDAIKRLPPHDDVALRLERHAQRIAQLMLDFDLVNHMMPYCRILGYTWANLYAEEPRAITTLRRRSSGFSLGVLSTFSGTAHPRNVANSTSILTPPPPVDDNQQQDVTTTPWTPVVWSTEFEVGINIIDVQHRKLFHYINSLGAVLQEDALYSGCCSSTQSVSAETVKAKRMMRRVLDDLVDYCVLHFQTEEDMFNSAAFSERDTHCHAHDSFVSKISSTRDEIYDALCPDRDACMDLIKFLSRWLIVHINVQDRMYVPCVLKAQQRDANTVPLLHSGGILTC
jgi:hemerythrin